MSGGISATTVLAAAAVAGTAYSVYNGEKQARAQAQAAKQAESNAAKQADQADQANNRAKAKQPDISAMLSGNGLDAKAGIGGTLLTGPGGVDPNLLSLGKSTLLGQ